MRVTAQAVILSVTCTAFAVTPALAQNTIDVVGLDGKSVVVDLSGVKRQAGPLQIIVPNDKRAARWIRQVIKLVVRQLP